MNRLLVITELFLPTKGGTAVWAAEVYRRLGGKEIHIVTAKVPGAVEFDSVHPNTIHRLDLRRLPWLRPESLVMYLRLFAKSSWLALSRRFDAIHAVRVLPEGLVAWAVARLTFRPVVIYAHGEELTTWGRGWKFRAMRFAFQHCDHVIANSDHTRNTLLEMGVADKAITLIHPGVDVTAFRPGLDAGDLRKNIAMNPNEKLVLSVGRLQRRKGFDQVIRAIAQLRRAGMPVRYVLAGIGEDRDYLDDLIRELGLVGAAHMLGSINAEDLPRWMNACDVFAMPNRAINGDNEGFGMVFIEASACGKPVLAGAAGGTGAAVLDGVTGLRVNGGSVEAVAQGLVEILSNIEMAREMGRRGLSRVQEEFAWEIVAEKTLALSRKISRSA